MRGIEGREISENTGEMGVVAEEIRKTNTQIRKKQRETEKTKEMIDKTITERLKKRRDNRWKIWEKITEIEAIGTLGGSARTRIEGIR